MKTLRRSALLLLLGLAATWARGMATEFPAREQLEREGWKISFAPPERNLAEALAQHIEDFEARLTDIDTAQPTFGKAELEERATELAGVAAEWCALPRRKADFAREFLKATERITRIENDMRAAFFPRVIELWRHDDFQARIKAGETFPGVSWPVGHERLVMHYAFQVTENFREGTITASLTVPEAITLDVPEGTHGARPNELATRIDAWSAKLAAPYADLQPVFVRMTANLAVANVVGAEIAAEPSAQWIVAGLSSWVWRELVFSTVKPEGANRYATSVPRLRIPTAHRARLDLEQWPTDDEAEHVEWALQVFINIAEHHGKGGVGELMREFWKLPAEQRTTAGLKEVYRVLWDEPLEARAPWRSLGPTPQM